MGCVGTVYSEGYKLTADSRNCGWVYKEHGDGVFPNSDKLVKNKDKTYKDIKPNIGIEKEIYKDKNKDLQKRKL